MIKLLRGDALAEEADTVGLQFDDTAKAPL
jgi:hypothetical protein